jgi:transposase
MRRLRLPARLAVDELAHRYRRADDPVARRRWQLLWLLRGGMATAGGARVTGSSANRVREIARRYRQDGPAGIGERRRANPGAAPLLDAAQQAQWRAALGGPAPDGGRWTGRGVAAWMGATLGRPVSEQRGREWRRRLGSTPPRPRPREARADPGAQAASKGGGSPPPSPR